MDDHELDDRIRSAVASLTRTAPEPLPLPHSITEIGDKATQGQGARHRLNGRPRPSRARIPRGRRQLVLAAASLLVVAIGIGGAVAIVNDGEEQAITTATDFVAPDGRLYLLPAADVDLSGGADHSTEPSVDEGSAIVVGRPTATGFEAIVAVVHLTTGPTSGQESGAEATIAGRSFREPDYPEGPWAEELPDGTWLEYQTAAGDLILEEVAAAITYDDGKVHFEPTETGIKLLSTIDDISGQTITRLIYPIPEFTPGVEVETPTESFMIITEAVTDPQAPLLWGFFAPSMERVVVRGLDGYIMTVTEPEGSENTEPEWSEITAIVWYSPTGHAVAVLTNRSRADALALAEGLRSVDEATWRAALTDPDSSDQEPESGLDPWPEVAEAEPEQNASIGDVVDASRLVSDAVPAGLELTLAVDNADLGPPLSTGSRAAYVGQANTATMWVKTFEPIDLTQIEKELSSYSGAVTSNVNGVEVVVLGDGFRQAMFEAGSRSFSISGSLHIGAEPLSDEELLTAALTIIEHSGPTVFPDELLGFTLAGVEATVGFDHPSEYPHMDGASPDGSTTVYSGPETADRNFGPSVEIQVRPAIDGAYIPYEVRLGPDGELIDLAGLPALITATESALVADEEVWVRRQPITDEEDRSLHVRLGDHQIAIFAFGLDRQQLIDFALALRTATDAEWGVGLS